MEYCASTLECHPNARPPALSHFGSQSTEKAFLVIPWDARSNRILQYRRQRVCVSSAHRCDTDSWYQPRRVKNRKRCTSPSPETERCAHGSVNAASICPLRSFQRKACFSENRLSSRTGHRPASSGQVPHRCLNSGGQGGLLYGMSCSPFSDVPQDNGFGDAVVETVS